MMPNEPIPRKLAAFLHNEIDNTTFRHADHVHVAFEILGRHNFPESLAAFSRALRSIAARAGNPGAYHETITVAFLSLIAERRAVGKYSNYAAFADANADLLDKSVLKRWYAPERLQSDIARQTFVLPEPTGAPQ